MNKIFPLSAFLLLTFFSFGQSVTISPNPNGTAIIDVSSTNKGFLPPRMTTSQRNAIITIEKGLMVYDTNLNQYCYWSGSIWECLISSNNCPLGFTKCGGECMQLNKDASNCGACGTVCAAGRTCVNGVCTIVCPAGQTNCGSACVSLNSDTNNCGACGTVCAAGRTCVNGVCTIVCPAGQTNCGGACVSLNSDTNNCGACGTTCPSGQTCHNGVCN